MAGDGTESESKGWNIFLWVLQIVGAGVFTLEGCAKLVGQSDIVDLFDNLGYGSWLRFAVAGIEVIGAFMILFPMSAEAGAWLLALVMAGAVYATAVVLHASILPPLAMLLLTLVIAVGRYMQRRHHRRHTAHVHAVHTAHWERPRSTVK